ncbi:MAG: FAD-dependent oxidoreductase [Cyanobacteria bacterium K_DeepCast_35m_m2_023]|nr:FAD-dependent oxidoreductase [Cyanobacteria bacterium K_DeepCast_35m_m2_023]
MLVWGGGSGGVAAALQAARRGARTLLLTPGPWLGGMLSAAGVCCPDGNELSPWQTGLWGALLRALAEAEPSGLDHNWVSCFGFQPATAEAILRRWVAAEPQLRWLANCRLLASHRSGDRLSRLEVQHDQQPLQITAQLVIDGSDLGDLLALGAAEYRLGWESRETWDEPSAPPAARLQAEPFFEQQPVQSPTWVAIGQRHGQAAGNPDGLKALPPPFTQATAAFGLERTLTYGRLPGDLTMLNWPLHGNDWHHDLTPLFAGDLDQQHSHLQQLGARMQQHSLDFAQALIDAADGGLALAQVFPDADAPAGALHGRSALALMPYWREGRRLLGLSTVLEQHLLPLAPGDARAALPADGCGSSSIAVGNYANDHHYPGGDWPLAPKSCRWGGRWSGTPFCIPYGALVSASCSNLLAADKCISVSHMANGATRLQPLVLNLGQAAGMAAALCLEHRCLPAELPVRALQRALIDEPTAPAAPLPLWDTPWHHPQWRQRQWAAVEAPERLDDKGRLDDGGATALLQPTQAPSEPHEQLWVGQLSGDLDQGYQLDCAGERWPVITLEPALHAHLATLRSGSSVRLIGCANSWGPWLRLSRLAD